MIRTVWHRWRPLPALLLLLLVASLLAGCDLQVDKTQPIMGDWSRGLRVGVANMREPIAMDVDSDIYLAWPQRGDDGIGVHYAHLNPNGKKLHDRDVETGLFFPRSYQLMQDPGGQLHLFVRGSAQSGEVTRLFHLLLNKEGDLLAQPLALTPATHDVETYDIVMYENGDIALAWHSSHSAAPGVYYVLIAGAALPPNPILAAPDGVEPNLALGADGTLHMIWATEPQFNERHLHYATSNERNQTLSDSTVVASLSSGTGTIFTAQSIGLDDGHVYIFWSTEFRAGMQQGDGTTEYVVFPRGAPEQATLQQVRVPDAGDLVYSDARAWIQQLWVNREPPFEARSDADALPQDRAMNYSQIYGLTPGRARASSKYIAYPAPINVDGSEMVVLFSVFTVHHMQEDVQPGMAVFIDGELIGYQLMARTNNYTWHNTAMADASGNMYSSWYDTAGEGEYDVYIGTTEPELKAGINRLTGKDILLGVIDTVWGMLSGLTLVPLAFIVMFLPLFWIAMVYIFGSDDSLTETGPRIAFAIAALLYYAGKLIIFSSVLSHPPMASIIPTQYKALFQVALLGMLLALAFGAFLLYAKRSGYPRLFMGFFIFAITDAVLTMLAYGPGFYR